jgi:NAD(P)H-flavin reductase
LRLLAERSGFGRISLLIGARSPDDLLFKKELERYGGDSGLDVAMTVDHAGRDWHGNVGVVTALLDGAHYDAADTVAFVCGPEIMMRMTAQGLTAGGVSPDRIYVSLERNMKCAIGFCGHCQLGPHFVCKDGPVFALDRVSDLVRVRGL